MRRFMWFRKGGCSCLAPLVSEYVGGRLGPDGRARVEEHMAACPRCRADVESLRATVALLRGLPEVVPARHFAVAPPRPVPGRWSLPALRCATAAAVVLLAGALAVDHAGLLVREADSGRYGAEALDGAGADYWRVAGVRNTIDSDRETPVVLVVPDGTESAFAAVESVSTNGMVYGSVKASADDQTRVVLKGGGEEAMARGEAEEFTVVSAPGGSAVTLGVNDAGLPSALGAVVKSREESHLSMVSSDYTALYSFDMADSERVTVAAPRADDDGWLRSVEYALTGLAALLGAATAGAWLWRRRERQAEARGGRDRH